MYLGRSAWTRGVLALGVGALFLLIWRIDWDGDALSASTSERISSPRIAASESLADRNYFAAAVASSRSAERIDEKNGTEEDSRITGRQQNRRGSTSKDYSAGEETRTDRNAGTDVDDGTSHSVETSLPATRGMFEGKDGAEGYRGSTEKLISGSREFLKEDEAVLEREDEASKDDAIGDLNGSGERSVKENFSRHVNGESMNEANLARREPSGRGFGDFVRKELESRTEGGENLGESVEILREGLSYSIEEGTEGDTLLPGPNELLSSMSSKSSGSSASSTSPATEDLSISQNSKTNQHSYPKLPIETNSNSKPSENSAQHPPPSNIQSLDRFIPISKKLLTGRPDSEYSVRRATNVEGTRRNLFFRENHGPRFFAKRIDASRIGSDRRRAQKILERGRSEGSSDWSPEGADLSVDFRAARGKSDGEIFDGYEITDRPSDRGNVSVRADFASSPVLPGNRGEGKPMFDNPWAVREFGGEKKLVHRGFNSRGAVSGVLGRGDVRDEAETVPTDQGSDRVSSDRTPDRSSLFVVEDDLHREQRFIRRKRYTNYYSPQFVTPMAFVHIQPAYPVPAPPPANRKCVRCMVVYKPCPSAPRPPPRIVLPTYKYQEPATKWRGLKYGE